MGKNLLIVLLSALLLASWFRPHPKPVALPSSEIVDEVVVPTQDPYAALRESISAMQAAPGLEAASLGLCVLSDGAEPVFEYRADEAMTPASTLKAITSATAMEMLGPDFRFETALGVSKEFTLDAVGQFSGDVLLIGGGDPMLSSIILTKWAGDLRSKGLKKLTGRIITDARCFPEQLIPNSWDWGDVSNYYGAGPCGLNLDFNRFNVLLKPGPKTGDPASIASMTPPLKWLERLTLATTGDSGSWTSIYGGPYAKTLTFRGNIPLGAEAVPSQGAIPDPAYHAAARFRDMLDLQGIEVTTEPTTMRRLAAAGQPLPESTAVLMKHTSDPLTDIVRYLHRTSDNMVTECLFQKLIQLDPLDRSGKDIVTMHWKKRGHVFDGLRMEDGSGLARADYIRPIDMARVLWLAYRGPHGEAYAATLNQYHDGRVRWKGGAMSRVRAYTGYTENGYTFALMINNYETDSETLGGWRAKIIEDLLALPSLR
ncbi:MAG: D-alanyl-D-alanine carboxypeptidase/D-alanyl-D-alanine-endopeptidase (penicillin-binding protein 4) [Verrucomicrobiales bacterium]|jgi:D-alanyl-D-alanine carboxypeptidase/D-alanyl-D-alanine-endopeptidase (penicillin-binding protein 4)